MLIFGHRFIESSSFYHITNIDDITNTPPSSTIYFSFSEKNLDIIQHANLNHITMALSVKDVTEVIYASALNATYIVVDKEIVKTAQTIAQEYLFDAKIIVKIDSDEEIEEMALLGIDAVMYPNSIIRANAQ